MMVLMIDKEMLLDVAKKKGLTNKEHIEKDYFQDLFLFHLYKKTNRFIFKGGTCLYKIYGLHRFSEDLDFSVIEKPDAEKIVVEIAGKIGANVKGVKRMKNSILIKIGFNGILTSYNTLRIDINLENAVFGYDVKDYVPPYIDINPFSMRVLGLKEILAEKIHSLLARDKARDLYDLFFLLRFVEPDKELIMKKLKIFGMTFDLRKFEKEISDLEDVWETELKPFVFSELPAFRIVKDFVINKLSE